MGTNERGILKRAIWREKGKSVVVFFFSSLSVSLFVSSSLSWRLSVLLSRFSFTGLSAALEEERNENGELENDVVQKTPFFETHIV